MISSLLAFLGGSVFRMLWGELSSFFNKQQEHKQEVERMRLQSELDGVAFQRNIESLKLHSELGIKEVLIRGESAVNEIETNAWLEAVKGTTKTVGIWFIDVWNGLIRPLVATWAIVLISFNFANKGWVLDENGWYLCSAALGVYLADRTLFKRGK